MTSPIHTNYSYYMSYEFYDDTLVCAVASVLEDINDEIAHPIMDPDTFGQQINSTVFNRLQYFGQNGLCAWAEDLGNANLLAAEWYLRGACLEGADITDFLD